MSEFVFQGESALTLDGKGRVTVPARFRDALGALCQGQMTLSKSPSRCLLLFPRPAWIEFRAKLLALPMEADNFRRLYLGSAMDVDIDSGSRVLLSPELRAWARLDKDLMLVGMGGRMEIWDRDRYLADQEATLAQPMPDALRNLVL
ncbi:division/cell wall cluster transcriptional repressor MraZ [Ideonella sp. YS5]|uniref:division/cell wall cluster transcriptional repressor MraZ n=1 Tax=Ideonella sp. YS5 TaxID=3453714 RepID=UPI003EEC2DF6